MISRRMALSVALGSMLCAASPALARIRPIIPQALDPDRDGTVSLDEIKAAASATFDRLDRDHDGTLTHKELRWRINAMDLAAADPDKDGTLSKDEFTALVLRLFKAADRDNDGTLTRQELRTKPGRALLRLLR